MEVETQQYDLSDLVRLAYEDQPAKMQDVFNELIMDRVHDSIMQKKIEVAQNFFGSDAEDEAEQDEQQEEDVDG